MIGMKLKVMMILRWRGSSEASAHRLSLGLVRKAPIASLKEEVRMVYNSATRINLIARLYTGAL